MTPADFFAAVANATDPRPGRMMLRAEACRLRKQAVRLDAFSAYRSAAAMRQLADAYDAEADAMMGETK